MVSIHVIGIDIKKTMILSTKSAY